MINNLYVVQRGQQYAIFTPQGIQIGLLFLGQWPVRQGRGGSWPDHQGTGKALGRKSKGLKTPDQGGSTPCCSPTFYTFSSTFFDT